VADANFASGILRARSVSSGEAFLAGRNCRKPVWNLRIKIIALSEKENLCVCRLTSLQRAKMNTPRMIHFFHEQFSGETHD